ncbi:MAG: hypothetical protein KAS71_11810 [Bacteroidales bacterium]|nr:hypothetical protein [Bacteroidales bacterium]
MKRVFYLLVLISPFQSAFLFSQSAISELMNEVRIIEARNSVGGLSYDNIKGSPHYSDAFVNSTVILKNGKSASLPLRYNLFQDEIEFKRDEKILWLIKNRVLSIQYGKEMILLDSFSEAPDKLTYFFVQEEGKYSLYIRKKVSFNPKVPPKGYTDPLPDRFEREQDDYYLKQEDMPLREIKNKKALSEILSENEPALGFIKKSKIKANKVEDLLELVRFLNDQ